jgi:Ras-related GTP-binding protein C/D
MCTQVNRYLALVCLMRADNLERQGLVEYNVSCFKRAIGEVFEARNVGVRASMR